MRKFLKRNRGGEITAFLYPSVLFISQFINIGRIHLSWVVYAFTAGMIVLNIGKIRGSKGKLYVLAFLLVATCVPVISYTYSTSYVFRTGLYFSIVTGCLVVCYIYSMDKVKFSAFMKGIFFSCLLFAFMGLYEMITGHYLFIHDTKQMLMISDAGSHYPIAAFTNSSDLAQYLVMMFPVSAIYYILDDGLTKKNKIKFLFISLFIFFIVQRSSSNLAIISFLLCYLVFGLSVIILKKRVVTIKMACMCFAAGMGALIILGLRTDVLFRLTERIFVTRTNVHFTGRAVIYMELIEQAVRHPFGGFGNAYSVFDPHNLFLYILCDYGIMTGIAFALVLIDLVWFFFNRIRKVRYKLKAELYLMIISSLIVFPLLSSISSGNEQRKVIYFFLGICFHLKYASIKPMEKNIKDRMACADHAVLYHF